MTKFKSSMMGFYTRELVSLSQEEIEDILEQGRKWNLAPALSKGGSIIFPHTLIHTCGDHVAAVVHGCLDTEARRVIVLGVMHSFGHSHIISARQKVRLGEDVSKETCRGIFGPHFPGDQSWKKEYSLESFCFLWDHEIKRRGIKDPPDLILAYPCLTNNEPWTLPGLEKLKSYLPNSLVIATADLYHHGKAYSTPEEQIIPISKEAKQYATATIENGFEIFNKRSYAAYQEHSFSTISDGSDVIQLLMYLKGALKPQILDLRLIDVAHLYENDPSPSWVVASLIEMTLF